mmetsp:Transcript_11045/g.30838  ORF Transcript_11045/g.30838 Transcript_11045/m.30838 type:complete len:246 (-) Transcript_11045:977-1714(-)
MHAIIAGAAAFAAGILLFGLRSLDPGGCGFAKGVPHIGNALRVAVLARPPGGCGHVGGLAIVQKLGQGAVQLGVRIHLVILTTRFLVVLATARAAVAVLAVIRVDGKVKDARLARACLLTALHLPPVVLHKGRWLVDGCGVRVDQLLGVGPRGTRAVVGQRRLDIGMELLRVGHAAEDVRAHPEERERSRRIRSEFLFYFATGSSQYGRRSGSGGSSRSSGHRRHGDVDALRRAGHVHRRNVGPV